MIGNEEMEKTEGEVLLRLCAALLDALFPRRCPVCGDIVMPKGERICPACLSRLSFVASPACKKCGKELLQEEAVYCSDCSRRRRSFEYGIALLNYNQAAARSMAAIKYKNRREYLDFYAQAALSRLRERLLSMEAECLVPIPIHPARMRKRGFNQAELLARKLGDGLGLPVRTDLLFRCRNTEPQKELGPQGRLKNLEKAFTAAPAADGPVPERVILVDDIYTTGSTIEACSRALGRAGVKKTYFFALCIGQGR